jgi:hypothetical protein
MRLNRRLRLSAHGALEFLFGIVIMLSPVVVSMNGAALTVFVLLGALQAGTALTVTADRGGGAAWHQQFDSFFVLITASCALALALSGAQAVALFLAAMVALQTLVNLSTSYATAG